MPYDHTKAHKAWVAWLESAEGLAVIQPETLGLSPSQRVYLSNRAWLAYSAGRHAGALLATEGAPES
jgi:hypothetical protein